jgi:hypothetical protein
MSVTLCASPNPDAIAVRAPRATSLSDVLARGAGELLECSIEALCVVFLLERAFRNTRCAQFAGAAERSQALGITPQSFGRVSGQDAVPLLAWLVNDRTGHRRALCHDGPPAPPAGRPRCDESSASRPALPRSSTRTDQRAGDAMRLCRSTRLRLHDKIALATTTHDRRAHSSPPQPSRRSATPCQCCSSPATSARETFDPKS